MINVAQITAQLAKLPDQQLQQYAMMHKSDPYIMALAVSEANRRKRLRASTNAGPAQESPKVADQAVAAMAPQSPGESGIAALPAGDMNFAGGGIVAFAEGGDVERYSGEFGSLTGASLDAARARAQAAQQRLYTYGLRQRQQDPAGFQTAQQELAAAQAALKNAEQGYAAEVSASGAGRAAFGMPTAPMMPAPTAPMMPAPTAPAADNLSGMDRRLMAGSQPSIASFKTPLPPKAPAGLGATPEADALQKSPAPAAAKGPSIQGAKGVAGQFLDTKGLHADLDKFYADEQAAVNAARKRQSEGKPEGKAYSKLEEALQAEEGRAGKEKSEAQGVAIFKAGLAMMAGTSRNAFENIGKGAMAGLEEYSGAIKDMKKAAKERQKALADIDNARRAEARDDWKAVQAFEERADARMSKAREFGIKSIMDITGKDAEISSKIYTTQVEQQGVLQRTNIQAGATLQAARIGADARGAGAGATADRQQLAELKALQKQYADQMKTTFNKPERAALQAKLATIEAAIAQMAGLGTMPTAPGVQSPSGTNQQGWSIKPLQ